MFMEKENMHIVTYNMLNKACLPAMLAHKCVVTCNVLYMKKLACQQCWHTP